MFPGNRKELAESQSQNSIELENELGLPGSPVAKTPHFHWRGCRFMQGAAKKKKKKMMAGSVQNKEGACSLKKKKKRALRSVGRSEESVKKQQTYLLQNK